MSRKWESDEAERKARLATGCIPLPEVLAKHGLPPDVLERTGLIFPLEHWSRKAHPTFSATLRDWAFQKYSYNEMWVKPGGVPGFLAMLKAVQAGGKVVGVGPWNRQVYARYGKGRHRAIMHLAYRRWMALQAAGTL